MSSNAPRTIVGLFNEQAKKNPHNIAVTCNGVSLSYAELEKYANQTARYLINLGVKQETLVPICVHRSLEMIIGLLGILKAGGAYVPIDPDYPQDRISYMLGDIGGKIVVTDSHSRQSLPIASTNGASYVVIDEEWETIALESSEDLSDRATPDNLAYIIYTSGSTGRPKGVMISHWNVVRLFRTESPLFDFNGQDVWTMFHSFCFDFSVWEMYGALLNGGRLVMVTKEVARDASLFVQLLLNEGVTILNQTPSAFYSLQEHIADFPQNQLLGVRYVIFGGEALNPSKLKPWRSLYDHCRLINMYGITETTVHVTYQEITDAQLSSTSSLIGVPIPTLYAYVLDENQQRVAPDTAGELYVGGDGLARGYLNMPELTASRFIHDPFNTQHPAKLYRTGDLVKQAADGTLEYLGRIDDQVKIRGFRIELGEIEHLFQQMPSVKHAVVTALKDAEGNTNLVGYYVPKEKIDKEAIRQFLRKQLPDYMIPQFLVEIDAIPLTRNGKVDKKSLPVPEVSELLSTAYAASQYKTEKIIAENWQQLLHVKRVGIHDNFFELGGNSLLAQKAALELRKQQWDVPVIKLYQYPTVQALAAFIDGRKTTPLLKARERKNAASEIIDVAIIGMAGRFPGASQINELWDILVHGKETIRFFDETELDASIPAAQKGDPDYVSARGIIEGAADFDAAFFGITPKLAELMDPQQRIFLEIAWEALERTGHVPQKYAGTIAVYAGCANNTYFVNNVLAHPDLMEKAGSMQVLTINDKDYISSRTAYALDLKGPAVTVQSACSTSLLAVAQAVESIRKGQCDIALAGGASVTAPIFSGHLYEEGAMLSQDGHCRPFDENSQGTLFSDGAGVVVLKSRVQAEKDGDLIYAVIKGVGISNDGGGKGSFTAPSAEGQANCIDRALQDAGIDPSTISYVETHGTATPLGDPIEIEGLKIAFGNQEQKQYCKIGSIKSNMGHLTHAAGVAGLIKTTLALHHKVIPPSINYRRPNPAIDFANSPFIVNDQLAPWTQAAGARRAGVSSFGVGGTNVHVVLEEFLSPSGKPETVENGTTKTPMTLINWSAKNESSLGYYAAHLRAFVADTPSVSLPDVAHTLKTGRQDFNFRSFLVAADAEDLLKQLEAKVWQTYSVRQNNTHVAFMFPGQGSQYVNMGRELYENEEVYKQAIDECARLLMGEWNEDLREVLFSSTTGSEQASERLKDTYYTQAAIFSTEYALAKLWMHRGIKPLAFIGHSVGEFVAAHLAGVFSLADALKLVAFRGRLISRLPSGSMLSVRMPAAKITASLPEGLSLAAVNAPSLCVVAGETAAINEFAAQLERAGVANRLLHTSHAFHSTMMEPILDEFGSAFGGIELHIPKQPIVSTVTGKWLKDEEAIDPNYWVSHVASTVRFSDALQFLHHELEPLLLEVGPGNVTATLARQHGKDVAAGVIDGLNASRKPTEEYRSFHEALGKLWAWGVLPDWDFSGKVPGKKLVDLPTYAFDKKRYWVEPLSSTQVSPAMPLSTSGQDIEIAPNEIAMKRKDLLVNKIKQLLEDASGIEIEGAPIDANFVELGLDSLLLTQISLSLKKEFGVPVTFRHLNETYYNLDLLSDYLDKQLPDDAFAVQHHASATAQPSSVVPAAPPVHIPSNINTGQSDAISLISQQIHLLSQQVALLQGVPSSPTPLLPAPASSNGLRPQDKPVLTDIAPEEAAELKKPFGATARIERQSSVLDAKQKSYLADFVGNYTAKTAKSKSYTQTHRGHMADPRVVSGFKPETKEIVYSIVVNKSKGSRLWDLDGNEYIDALNGFGSNMLGYQPDVIKKALLEQIEEGYEIGPQHEKAGEVCKLICEFTNFDRSALCNTGSEAVLGAMRIARTVTGRSVIVVFTNSYHGIMDEVIVRGTKKLKSFAAAPGILPEAVQNMLVLDYGTPESLEIIRERSHEIAAVLVEPVQSRRPEFVPVEFLKELRQLTTDTGTVLIFDEVISGFRFHPRGAQGLFGIQADIATYGKVAGAGISIGIIAGKKQFMDALDGGFWQYGDASLPEAGVTYFAGTFVRHPLALATTKAALLYMKEQGPQLQENLNDRTSQLANALNLICEQYEIPIYIAQFGSVWKVKYKTEYPYSELLFAAMRLRGIHILDGFPCFLTTAHTQADIDSMVRAFRESVHELVEAGFIPSQAERGNNAENQRRTVINVPPHPNAKLGKDLSGNPAWFIEDHQNPGKYLQIALQ